MPWTAAGAKRHNSKLTDAQAKQWASVANSVLSQCIKDGGDTATCEKRAVIQANGVLKKAREAYEMEKPLLVKVREDYSGIQILETRDVGGVTQYKLQIIRPGISKNRNVYSPQNMKEIASQLSSSRKMFVDHVPPVKTKEDFMKVYPRSTRDWAATVHEASVSETGPVHAWVSFRATEDGKALEQDCKNTPEELGVSIDAFAKARAVKDAGDGRPGVVIESINRLMSADFVTSPAAGGGAILESASEDQKADLANIVSGLMLQEGEKDQVTLAVLSRLNEYLIGEVASVFDEPEEKVSEAEDSAKGKVKSFKAVIEDQKKVQRFYETLWQFHRYVRDLVTNEVMSRKEKIEQAQEGVVVLLDAGLSSPKQAIESFSLAMAPLEEHGALQSLLEEGEDVVENAGLKSLAEAVEEELKKLTDKQA